MFICHFQLLEQNIQTIKKRDKLKYILEHKNYQKYENVRKLKLFKKIAFKSLVYSGSFMACFKLGDQFMAT
jgi:hypothetical protein